MAGLMLWADLAVTADGLTKYETAVTGTPSIIIAQAEQKSKVASEFEKRGSAWHLGHGSRVSERDIARAVAMALQDDSFRREMSKNGRKLVDGRGIERIISAIPSEVWA